MTTTVRVYPEEKMRLDFYKGVFGFTSVQDVIKAIMDRAGLASVEDIKRQRVIHRISRLLRPFCPLPRGGGQDPRQSRRGHFE